MNEELNYEKLLENAIKNIPKKSPLADRFKVPKAIIEMQGSKTLIRNFLEIANALTRKPEHLAKYLEKELAVPGSIQGSQLKLQGKFSTEIIQKKIDNYIRDFVYCKVCGEPDTKIIKDRRLVFMQCDACGAKSPLKTI